MDYGALGRAKTEWNIVPKSTNEARSAAQDVVAQNDEANSMQIYAKHTVGPIFTRHRRKNGPTPSIRRHRRPRFVQHAKMADVSPISIIAIIIVQFRFVDVFARVPFASEEAKRKEKPQPIFCFCSITESSPNNEQQFHRDIVEDDKKQRRRRRHVFCVRVK